MELLSRLSNLDQRLFLRCTHYSHNRCLTMFARLISKTGDGYMQVLLPLALLVTNYRTGLPIFQITAAAFAAERALYWLLKNTLKRPRPPVAIPWFNAAITAADEFSFPSGHTSGAFLLAGIFFIYMPMGGCALFVWASLVGLSRLVLGVHFPADILAGASLGCGIAWLAISLV